ncbi:MAG: hypothetical protein ABSH38_01990 [Verrucomicrobiota bacterium]|jgi:hypothetical protein
MKSTPPFQDKQIRRCGVWLLVLGAAVSTVVAAETNAPPAAVPAPLTPEQMFEGGSNSYNNWIEFSTGGILSSGNQARFQQQHQISGAAFGGIAGLHYGTNLDKTTTLTLDGRAIADEHDYKLKLDIEREKTGFLRLSYSEFRTWSDGDGGFFPPSDMNYPLSKNALGLDRGAFSLEGGLTPEKGINAVFKYTHTFREGEEDSTSWGDTHPASSTVTQGLSPTVSEIHEHADSFQLDLSDHVKKTDLGLGLHYETGKLDDALKITQFPGEPIQQKITSQQDTHYDVFDVHTFTETWVRTNLLFSSGFSYSHLDNSFSGSRIYGSDFDVGYVPNAQYGFGYFALSGGSSLQEYVMDLNLLYKPTPYLTVIPSVRVQKDDWTADSGGFETLGAALPVAFAANSDAGDLDVRGRIDLAYRGFTNWVLHACLDLTEVDGNLDQYGGLIPVGGIGLPAVQSATDNRNVIQKYTAGARWYPSRRITIDAGGYYKLDVYHYGSSLDSTPNNSPNRYPGYLEMQKFATYDGNFRLTLRPLQNVSLVSRYEYQWSTIHTAPDPLAGLPDVESATMRTHILAQDISWTPWSRLCLQAGFNYVLSDTATPASEVTQAILDARNNYWTVNFSSGLVLDNKTDLNVSYFYYQADDYSDNSPAGVPYGAGGQEHSITATLTRRISERVRLSLKYGYFRYLDAASGGNADYGASLIYATLRYRF